MKNDREKETSKGKQIKEKKNMEKYHFMYRRKMKKKEREKTHNRKIT